MTETRYGYRLEHRVTHVLSDERPVNVRLKTTFYGLAELVRSVSEPAEEGQELSIPRWLARILVNKGLASYASPQPSLRQRLARSIWQEEQTTTLPKLPETFYVDAGDAVEELAASGEQATAGVQSRLQDLLRIRLKKIRRFAETKSQLDFLENLTPEEKSWFHIYREWFTRWVEGEWLNEALDYIVSIEISGKE